MSEAAKKLIFNPQWITVVMCALAIASMLIYGGRVLERMDYVSSVAKAFVNYQKENDERVSKIESFVNYCVPSISTCKGKTAETKISPMPDGLSFDYP